MCMCTSCTFKYSHFAIRCIVSKDCSRTANESSFSMSTKRFNASPANFSERMMSEPKEEQAAFRAFILSTNRVITTLYANSENAFELLKINMINLKQSFCSSDVIILKVKHQAAKTHLQRCQCKSTTFQLSYLIKLILKPMQKSPRRAGC